VESPPDDRMRMPAVSQESRLCTIRAQAREHEWQPMQRSMRGVVRIFMAASIKCKFFDTEDSENGYDNGG
jgi:hypothetical protein